MHTGRDCCAVESYSLAHTSPFYLSCATVSAVVVFVDTRASGLNIARSAHNPSGATLAASKPYTGVISACSKIFLGQGLQNDDKRQVGMKFATVASASG